MRPIDREVCRTVGEQMIEAAATYPERDMPDWARWDGELAEFQVGSLTVRCRPFREDVERCGRKFLAARVPRHVTAQLWQRPKPHRIQWTDADEAHYQSINGYATDDPTGNSRALCRQCYQITTAPDGVAARPRK